MLIQIATVLPALGKLDAEASFGMNIALGGYGTVSEGRRCVVTDDGTFGHMYLFWIPPTHAECAILVGVEGEEPGVRGLHGAQPGAAHRGALLLGHALSADEAAAADRAR